VGTPTAVGVNNDLATSQAGVTLGTADDEEARGLDLQNEALLARR
jgi:hypothetical protein